jgi:hypothetical protein
MPVGAAICLLLRGIAARRGWKLPIALAMLKEPASLE